MNQAGINGAFYLQNPVLKGDRILIFIVVQFVMDFETDSVAQKKVFCRSLR